MPNELAWDITVNVMQANNDINKEIKEHIQTSVTKLMEILRSHYDQVESNLEAKKKQLEEEIDKLKTSDNEQIIQQTTQKILKETKELNHKLETK